jgi:hypothetical protein
MKYVRFPWSPLEEALSVLTLAYLLETVFETIKQSILPSMPNHNFSKNVFLEKIRSAVQYNAMSQTNVTALIRFSVKKTLRHTQTHSVENAKKQMVLVNKSGPGQLNRYSDSLRVGRSEDRIPVGGGEIFRTRSDRPWGPPSPLYNGYRVFPGGQGAGAWR